MTWSATAPANIALIKYMGKAEGTENIPLNASLSYTLPQLCTHVELEICQSDDHWEPLKNHVGFIPHVFREDAQARFLKHLKMLKTKFNCTENFTVRSANNFPHGTGLASSASSFAALTKAALKAIAACSGQPLPDTETQAHLSRLGSGSSCRSFFEPWAFWDKDAVREIALPYPKLIHQVILVQADEKKVSSSEAHRRVSVLPEYPARKLRAEQNLKDLCLALTSKNWQAAYDITWREFQDMHGLFSQCNPSFSYITPETEEILKALETDWEKAGDGPLVTMDAGPNIHLLYRPDQAELVEAFKVKAKEQVLHVL